MTEEDKIVNTIAHSFATYAFGDIEHCRTKSIAALILCTCLIDQIAAFVYCEKRSDIRWPKFIEEYMPQYEALKLYEFLRSGLVHDYTLRGHYRITEKPMVWDALHLGKNANIISSNTFIDDLRTAFSVVLEEMAIEGTKTRQNAIKWFRKNGILIEHSYQPVLYNDKEYEFLTTHYSDIMIGKFLSHRSELKVIKFDKISSEVAGHYLVQTLCKRDNDDKEYWCEIDQAAIHFKVDRPLEVLKRLI